MPSLENKRLCVDTSVCKPQGTSMGSELYYGTISLLDISWDAINLERSEKALTILNICYDAALKGLK